jgi:hypothetical protein
MGGSIFFVLRFWEIHGGLLVLDFCMDHPWSALVDQISRRPRKCRSELKHETSYDTVL